MDTPEKSPDPSPGKQSVSELLAKFQEMATKGELQAVVVGYVKNDGGAAVQSTPMSAITMNHLSMLLQRRVAREYDRALQQAGAPRPGTGAGPVPEQPRQAANLPRKVRREAKLRLENLAKLQRKQAKKKAAVENVVRNPAPPVEAQANGRSKV